MIPDKIYIPLYPNHSLDGVHLGDDWMYEPHKECDNAEYIRKEALLEWATTNRDKLDVLSDNDAVRWGQRNAFQQMIDKLNQM